MAGQDNEHDDNTFWTVDTYIESFEQIHFAQAKEPIMQTHLKDTSSNHSVSKRACQENYNKDMLIFQIYKIIMNFFCFKKFPCVITLLVQFIQNLVVQGSLRPT